MSASTASTTSSEEGANKGWLEKSRFYLYRALQGAALVAVLYWGVPPIMEYFQPKAEAGVRAVTNDAHTMIAEHAGGVKRQMIGDRDHIRDDEYTTVDIQTWRNSRRPLSEEVAEAQNAADAEIAVATRRIPLIPQAVVMGNQQGWTTMAPAFEPLHVTVPAEDTVKPTFRSSETSAADGIYPEGLPEKHAGKLTVIAADRKDRGMQEVAPGNLYELIGRVCNGGQCTPALPMGTEAVICQAPAGHFQAWYNGFVEIGRIRTLMDFSKGVGHYRLTIRPDEFARRTCAENPGIPIVEIHRSAPMAPQAITVLTNNNIQGGY